MKNTIGLADGFLKGMSYEGHIPMEEGDYIGPEGRVHCGKCNEGKELFLKALGRYVPSLCRCGRIKRAETDARLQEAWEMERVNELKRYSLMDAKLQAATFENAEKANSDAFRFARNYVDKFDEICRGGDDMKGLMLYGPTGTGKSYLAACIANALMAKRIAVLFTSIVKITGYGTDALTELIDHMGRARLLVLDDLGAERSTDFKLEQVYAVIDRRINSRKPLIVTTNVPLNEMTETGDIRYNRIWERVRAMCYPVRMDSENWRRNKAAEAKRRFMATMEGK